MIHLLLSVFFSPLLKLLAGKPPSEPKRLLIIQLAKIGDLLCSTPVFRELKQRYPDMVIHVLASPVNAPLLRTNPHVDAVIEASVNDFSGAGGKWHLVRLLRQGRYDTVVCLNAGAAYATAAAWALIPRRLAVLSNFGGSSHRLAARLWTDVEPHVGDRLIQETYLALLAKLGVENGRIDKEVFPVSLPYEKKGLLFEEDDGVAIGIAVSSANRLKALGSDKLASVVQQLLTACPRSRVFLIGGSEDRAQADEIIERVALSPGKVINSCGQFSLIELPLLLKRMTVFLGVDSGVTYMADTVGIPVVSVAGPCNMDETRPLGEYTVILQRKELPCAPCAHIFRAPYQCHVGTRECITSISPAEISQAVLSVLENLGVSCD